MLHSKKKTKTLRPLTDSPLTHKGFGPGTYGLPTNDICLRCENEDFSDTQAISLGKCFSLDVLALETNLRGIHNPQSLQKLHIL